jgi:hypothetical protein
VHRALLTAQLPHAQGALLGPLLLLLLLLLRSLLPPSPSPLLPLHCTVCCLLHSRRTLLVLGGRILSGGAVQSLTAQCSTISRGCDAWMATV